MPPQDQPPVVVEGYKESDDFVPRLSDHHGTFDTSGTSGAAHQQMDTVSPIFEVGRKEAAILADRALDPNDDGVDSSLVSTPADYASTIMPHDPEKTREDIKAKADAARENPVVIGGPLKFAREAAESADGTDGSDDNPPATDVTDSGYSNPPTE